MAWFNRFPSHEYIAKSAAKVFARFPFTIICSLLAAFHLVLLIEHDNAPSEHQLQKLSMIFALGLPLFSALAFFAEKRQSSRKVNLAIQSIGVVVLAILYFTFPADITWPEMYIIRVALLAVAFHFLAAFLPFLGGDQVQGFWQFNKALFLRFLLSGLYSAVMFIGLAIALAAIDKLFDAKIDANTYGQLWVLIAVGLNTWIFLAGIPEDIKKLNETTEYPKGLRIFTQYILLPLVGVYLVILYAYGLKIVFEWNWPRGMVSQLVLWYSVVSLLAMLLLWPLRDNVENKWIRTFSTWIFRLLVPLLVMLFLAIFERIGEYGVTINRHLVIAMATGLAVVVLYFVLSRKKDVRIIPIVIFCVAMLSAYGPLSAFSISEWSQTSRLDQKLREHDIVLSGEPDAITTTDITLEERQKMSSIIDYLVQWHGRAAFSQWFSDSTIAAIPENDRTPNDDIAKLFGFEYAGSYAGYHDIYWEGKWFTRKFLQDRAIEVGGYQYLFPLDYGYSDNTVVSQSYQTGTDSLRIEFNQMNADLTVTLLSDTTGDNQLSLNMTKEFAEAAKRYFDTDSTLTPLKLMTENEKLQMMLIGREVTGSATSDSVVVNVLKGSLLLRKK